MISLVMSALTVSGYSGSPQPAGEDQAAAVVPGRCGGEAFCCLLAVVLAQDGDGFAVDADGAGPAALGGAFDALAAHGDAAKLPRSIVAKH